MSRRRDIRYSVEFPLVPPVMRLLKIAFAAMIGLIAVWIDAVLETPRVKRRKALRRSRRTLPKS
jgi:hypothetical protein